MTTTTVHPLAELLSHLSGKPCHDAQASCQPCARYELQFLPVLPSVVAAEYAGALKAAGYAWAPSFDRAFTDLPRHATHPVARLARAGYVYLYYPEWQTWDVWQVMSNGLTRKLLHQVACSQYERRHGAYADAPEPKLCSQGAANVPAHLIGITAPGAATRLWIAFSERLWTGPALQRFADNPEVDVAAPSGPNSPGGPGGPGGPNGPTLKARLRSLRGLEVNPQAILAGQLPVHGALPLNEEGLKANLVDYCARREGLAAGTWPSRDFERAFTTAKTRHPLTPERFGQAATFAQRVRQLERALAPPSQPERYAHKTLMLMLPDAVGVAEAHNDLRLQTLQAHQGWLAGDADAQGRNADPQRPWKRQSLLHAGYLREWVKAQQKAVHQQRLQHGVYRRHTVISDFEYQKLLEHERRFGNTVNPPGTSYEKLPGAPERWRVTFPEETAKQGINHLAAADAQGRLERYNAHLDHAAIDQALRQWEAAETAWLYRLERLDLDYVAWLEQPAHAAALRYDFDEQPAWQTKPRTRDHVRRDVREAIELQQTLARCYGGGACSGPSLKHLVALFGKDENDPSHFIAQGMLTEVGLQAVGKKFREPDASTQSDLYGVYQSSGAAWREFQDAWATWREQATVTQGLLLQVAYQVTQKMQELALSPELAQQHGLKVALADASQKQALWVQAAGFSRFLETGQRQYLLGLAWRAGAFTQALEPVGPLRGPAVDAAPRSANGATGKQARRAAKQTHAEIKVLLAQDTAERRATVLLLVDEQQLARVAYARGENMIEVVSPGLFGQPQAPLRIPESLAREAVANYRITANVQALRSGAAATNMAALVLSWYALQKSWQDLQKQGGPEQVDTALSGLGSIVGIVGSGVEIGALLLTPPAVAATQGTPAAAVLAKMPVHLWLRFAAGIGLAAGAGVSAAVAFVKAYKRTLIDDVDARNVYIAVGFGQFSGAVSLAAGSYYAHRARVLSHYGQEAVVRMLSRNFTPVQLGRCLTGVGLLLFVGGIALSFYALYLEDDENEVFLRRSFFGKGHPQLGKFTDLEQEVRALGALALGTKAEVEWHDHLTTADEVTVRVKVFQAEPNNLVTAVLEGFDSVNGRKVTDLYNGEMPLLTLSTDTNEAANGVHTAERKFIVPPGVQAVRLSYTFCKDRLSKLVEARGELWLAD